MMKSRHVRAWRSCLLTILKFDEKNAAAYNRLGILYAKSQRYDEAVECFEIAQSLDNDQPMFNILGMRVTPAYKGLIIRQGRKYIMQ